MYEAILSRDLGELSPSAVGRIARVFKSYGLPIVCPPEYLKIQVTHHIHYYIHYYMYQVDYFIG